MEDTTAQEHASDTRGKWSPYEISNGHSTTRVISVVMGAAVALIIIAMVATGLHFVRTTEDMENRAKAAAVIQEELRGELNRARESIDGLFAYTRGSEAQRAAALAAAVVQVTESVVKAQQAAFDAQTKALRSQFDKEFKRLEAQRLALVDELRALGARLEAQMRELVALQKSTTAKVEAPKCQLLCL